jgi:uncharacterized membrane protein YgcG
MKKQTAKNIESVDTAEIVDTAETASETSVVEPKQSRAAAALDYVKGAPKWVLMSVPALAVALAGYGYMQQQDGTSDSIAQAPMVAGPYGQVQQANMPVAYAPAAAYNAGPNNGNYGGGDAYGNGYGRGHGNGNGRARGNFSFSMGGDMSGSGNGWGNGYGDGAGHNRYSKGYYY